MDFITQSIQKCVMKNFSCLTNYLNHAKTSTKNNTTGKPCTVV